MYSMLSDAVRAGIYNICASLSRSFMAQPVQELHGDTLFAHDLQLLCLVGCDQGHHVRVRTETGTGDFYVVPDDHVEILLHELAPGPVLHIGGLHGEAAENLSFPLVVAEVFERVLGALQGDTQVVIGFLDLLVADTSGAVVCDSRRFDDDVLLIGDSRDRVKEVAGGLYGHQFDARRRRQRDGA